MKKEVNHRIGLYLFAAIVALEALAIVLLINY